MILSRTWPYGTMRKARVLNCDVPVQSVIDDRGELHLLIGPGAADVAARPGDTGMLVFVAGGPTGGHWRFEKDGKGKRALSRALRRRCAGAAPPRSA